MGAPPTASGAATTTGGAGAGAAGVCSCSIAGATLPAPARSAQGASGHPHVHYGFVVDNVNVSVLAYVPVRSGSVEPMCCSNSTATTSFDTGAAHVLIAAGSARLLTVSGCA